MYPLSGECSAYFVGASDLVVFMLSFSYILFPYFLGDIHSFNTFTSFLYRLLVDALFPFLAAPLTVMVPYLLMRWVPRDITFHTVFLISWALKYIYFWYRQLDAHIKIISWPFSPKFTILVRPKYSSLIATLKCILWW